ncbi:helicase associated domain-containing protein [Streptomyces sp. NPDC021218]|uniref:helicase associated domain-containing protein n=1 Tax=Streptomyces sp. NPDC021218 TaxID=3365119 RepID=UPI0037B25536
MVPLCDGGTYALGAWVNEQRRQFRLGTLKAWRAELLDELGMVWSVTDARFYRNLSVARGYYAVHGTLAAHKDAVFENVAVGQWLANLRKPGGLGKDEERAEVCRATLVAIDPDWNPKNWPIDWQRHYAALTGLLGEGATLAEIVPGVTFRGQDIGTWLTTQRQSWEHLSDGQRERLAQHGVVPLPPEPEAPAKPPKATSGAFERGVAALAQDKARTGSVKVPRAHVEVLPDGTKVKLGVFLSNTKARRAKRTKDKLQQLAALGLGWAA